MGERASKQERLGLGAWIPIVAGNVFFFGFVLTLLFPSLKDDLLPIVGGAGMVILVLTLPIFTLLSLISLFSRNNGGE